MAATLISLVLVIGAVAAAPKTWAVLVIEIPAAWSWYLTQNITPGHGTIIGGTFVCVAALIAYTGTHLSRRSTERIANNNNNLADNQELRRRFVTTTAQFADPSPEVRLAGVYALEALTDDWIDRGKYTDAQICINYLCSYLTRPYTPPTEHPHLRQTVVTSDAATHIERTYQHPRDDLTVRQAITRTIVTHLKPDHHHNWSRYNYDLTGAYFHNADFTDAHFCGNTTFGKAQFHGDRTTFHRAQFHSDWTSFVEAQFRSDWTSFVEAQFRGGLTSFGEAQFHGDWTSFGMAEFRSKRVTSFGEAQFHGDWTSFGLAQFRGGWTSFGKAQFHGDGTTFYKSQFRSKKQTSFDEAQFRSKKQTSFDEAQFHGDWTTFYKAQFRGDQTTFYKASFQGAETSFYSPGAWNNVYFDWDTEIPCTAEGIKPDNVKPHDWPPPVLEPMP
ncbi:putative uncharacterized protein [Rhodococcus sp. AW25M09]|uniref:pentapeptide repeat-containing protein n=1 Tax=Rhodococcus sp. AW25M09 TaxID=1268303 RepID=UPI0002AC165A|nr:pentapeptide repeat-containing protein [Rhodococcus sp. AW25M09]CCQ18452.1 putative uncharacterized protein [Rhodococcus sp. AW25M09]